MHALLIYEIAPDYLERRGQYRDAHLRLAWEATERGELALAGAVGNPPEGAILLFQGDDALAAGARFAAEDPYVVNGVVRSWRVVPWTTVAGEMAANPVRPK